MKDNFQEKHNYDDIKIGLALGGGGAKGMSQIGIYKVFENFNIKPSYIAGTSIGSIVGGAMALGLSSDEIKKRSQTGKSSKKMTKIGNFSFFRESLVKDSVIEGTIKEIIDEDKTFDDIKIPFICSAVDLESGKEVVMNKGKLWQASRASSAIPFIMSPYFLNGQYLVDGGLLNMVPVDHVRNQKDIDIVIGVELGGRTSRQYISGIVWEKYYKKPKSFEYHPGPLSRWRLNMKLMSHVLFRALDIMGEENMVKRYAEAKPDLVIEPKVDDISLLDFDKFDQGYNAGIEAAQLAMPRLLKIIEEKRKEKQQRKEQLGQQMKVENAEEK